jgi:competence/damage-inducible protein cinA C-terminal domain
MDELKPEEQIGELLRHKGLSIATAESCTVGSICALIGRVAGASDYLQGGIIAYQAELKDELLGVPLSLIEKYHVVSREVAEAMALGISERLHTDIGIASTGIAGPTGGDSIRPVGTVWLAAVWHHPEGDQIRYKQLHLIGSRTENIAKATEEALYLVIDLLQSTDPSTEQ